MKLLSLTVLFLSLGLSGCNTTTTTITISGSSTVLPVVSTAAERYMADHPDIRIVVSPGGSGVGVQSVAQGLADIGMVSRPISDAEHRAASNSTFNEISIGKDAVACVVSEAVYRSGITSLTRDQIRDIYDGKLDNWEDVGGPNRPILCIDKEAHRGTRQVFMSFIFGDERPLANGADLVTGSNNEEHTKLTHSDAAIGMLSYAWVDDRVRAIGIESDGDVILPTAESIRAHQYPISRDLNLVVLGDPPDHVAAFISFILSPAGQKIVADAGYVPVR